jgi:hypothetical protein
MVRDTGRLGGAGCSGPQRNKSRPANMGDGRGAVQEAKVTFAPGDYMETTDVASFGPLNACLCTRTSHCHNSVCA